MKYLLYLISLFSFPLTAQQIDVNEWKEKWMNSRDYTMELLNSIPEDSLDYAPTSDQMTVREQFQHMGRNIYFLAGRVIGYKPEGHDQQPIDAVLQDETLSKIELEKALEKSFAYGVAAIEGMNAADFDEKVDFFAGPKTRRQIFWLLQNHVTHHRGQVIVYVRLLGIKPPRFRGW